MLQDLELTTNQHTLHRKSCILACTCFAVTGIRTHDYMNDEKVPNHWIIPYQAFLYNIVTTDNKMSSHWNPLNCGPNKQFPHGIIVRR